MTTLMELHERMAAELADSVLRTQVIPRAEWTFRRPVVPSCGHGDLTWFDWPHPDRSLIRVLCDECLSRHLGSEDGDVHWDPVVGRKCAAGCVQGGELRPVQMRIRLTEPAIADGGAVVTDGQLNGVPLLWLCRLHSPAFLPPADVTVDNRETR